MQHEATMNRITKLVNERLDLYMLAGHHRLTDAQRDRITHITNQLPGLWDQYRREFAARRSSTVGKNAAVQPRQDRRAA